MGTKFAVIKAQENDENGLAICDWQHGQYIKKYESLRKI